MFINGNITLGIICFWVSRGKMKIGGWGQKSGFLSFSLNHNFFFGYEYSYSGVKNIQSLAKPPKATKNVFQLLSMICLMWAYYYECGHMTTAMGIGRHGPNRSSGPNVPNGPMHALVCIWDKSSGQTLIVNKKGDI